LSLFAIQPLLNITWSWIFFGLHQPGWAFDEILVLWMVIVATAVASFA
jgi:tryptophan-rich sensory protein